MTVDGHTMYFTYDAMYRTATAALETDTGLNLSAAYTYDDDLLTSIETASTTYNFTYGNFALRDSVAVGNKILASYDYQKGTNRLERLDYGNQNFVKYTYDDQGRVTQQTYEDDSYVTYKYDNSGALAKVYDSQTDTTSTYYYDFTDRRMKYVEKSSTGTHSVGYEYDDINNLTALVETINGVERQTSYAYDGDNRPTSVTDESGGSRSYTYDYFGRISTLTTKHGSTIVTIQTYTYKVNADGTPTNQISGITVKDGNGNQRYTDTYTYDQNGNITGIDTTTKVGEQETTLTTGYVYDSANQLIREDNQEANTTTIWTYDNAGNILTRTVYPYGNVTADEGTQTNYRYTDAQWGDLLKSYDSRPIIRDAIGNPTNDLFWSYTWQHGRQLASMTDRRTLEQWQFTYNADGLRTQRTNGTTTYNYTYLGSQLTHMTVDGHTMYFSYDAAGIPLSLTYDSVTYYYVTNLQGDVVAILNSSGTEVVTYAYDAWGNIISPDVAEDTPGFYNPLRYRGYVYDEETKLYYLQSRYYDPEMGRFINGDGFVTTGQGVHGNNMFAYCGNNPVCRKDITGTRYCEATSIADESAAARSVACQFQNKVALERQNTKNLMMFYGVTSPKNIPEMPDGAMLFLENISSVSISGPLAIVRGQTVVLDRYKYCVYNFTGVGLSAALVSIPLDYTITAGYVYGLNTVTDYCGAFVGGSSNLVLDIAGGAVACNGVYAEIIRGNNYVPSLGLSITNYTTTQTNWIYGPANITFLPNLYPKFPGNSQVSV